MTSARALRALKNGASLHFSHDRGRPSWRLSTGNTLTREVAEEVTRDPHVVGVGDSLFSDLSMSQTFRWTD
jgi:hypothetical protein